MNRSILRKASSIAAATALLSALRSPCSAAPAASTAGVGVDDNVRARALFRQGVDAFRAGNNAEAIDALTQAWAIRKTYDVAGALAQAELALGRYSDAAEHLDYCVNHFAPAESEQSLLQVKAALADVKQHVATLTVSLDRAGAEVQIDARILGVSPLGVAVYVDPGVHTLQARLGAASASQVVNVQAGQAYALSVRIGGAGPDVVPAPSSNMPEATRSMVPVLIGGAVAAVGIVGLIAFSSKSSSDNDTRQALQNQNGRSGCADGTAAAADCAAQRDAANGHDRDRNLAISSAIVGALGLAVIPIYLAWPRHQGDAGPVAASFNVRVHLAISFLACPWSGNFSNGWSDDENLHALFRGRSSIPSAHFGLLEHERLRRSIKLHAERRLVGRSRRSRRHEHERR